jgi:hypothetical protein
MLLAKNGGSDEDEEDVMVCIVLEGLVLRVCMCVCVCVCVCVCLTNEFSTIFVELVNDSFEFKINDCPSVTLDCNIRLRAS